MRHLHALLPANDYDTFGLNGNKVNSPYAESFISLGVGWLGALGLKAPGTGVLVIAMTFVNAPGAAIRNPLNP